MKKLLLMFVMLLGSVAMVQAQTFDFSCEDDAESALPFDVDQDALFSDAQVVALEAAGFIEGRQVHADGTHGDVNHYGVNIQIGPNGEVREDGSFNPGITASVRLDVEGNGDFVVTTFNTPVNSGLLRTTPATFELALSSMITAYATITPYIAPTYDADANNGDGIITIEETPFVTVGSNDYESPSNYFSQGYVYLYQVDGLWAIDAYDTPLNSQGIEIVSQSGLTLVELQAILTA